MIQRLAVGALLSVALAAGAFLYGQSAGVHKERARNEQERLELQRQLFDLGETVSRQAAQIAAERAARETLAKEIEDEARRDPRAHERVPSDDSMRRVQRRWGAP